MPGQKWLGKLPVGPIERGKDDKLYQPSIKRDIISMQGNLMLKHLPNCDQNPVNIMKKRSENRNPHNRKRRTEKKGYTEKRSPKN